MLSVKTIQTIANQEGWKLEINKESYDFTNVLQKWTKVQFLDRKSKK